VSVEWRVVVKAGRPGPHYIKFIGEAPLTERSAHRHAVDLAGRGHVEWVRVERRTVTPWEEA